MAEVGWVLTFLAIGEADPEIWVVPLLLGVAGVVAIMAVARIVPRPGLK